MTKENKGLSDELTATMKQLVMNGHLKMAGTVLHVYFLRCWQLEDELAAYYVVRYFGKYYPKQLEKYRKQTTIS
ncbi:hypothetical protein [Paenibacillus sp. NPDC057934]|uniref:hypothetical protein n=1 Tax=Paenibacillus sp. NPDC057934 TaxID=3346282 RepID=UPI0036DC73B1